MDVETFEKLLKQGRDNALLRFTLGQGYLDRGDAATAVKHLAEAVRQDETYSAAWKLYGRALLDAGDAECARNAWENGIRAAEAKGDKQAAKEMQVFLKRLARERADGKRRD